MKSLFDWVSDHLWQIFFVVLLAWVGWFLLGDVMKEYSNRMECEKCSKEWRPVCEK